MELCSIQGCIHPGEQVNNVSGYEFLCRKHHVAVDGRGEMLAAISRGRANRVKRICPSCFTDIFIEPYRLRSKLNFCSHSCRWDYYLKPSPDDVPLESQNTPQEFR